MRKTIYRMLGLTVLIGMLFALGGMNEAAAGVSISINIGLPAFVLPAPPPVVVIPGTYVYVVPDIDVTFLFYHGYWYRPYEGRWYMASSYNGPWAYIELSRVPRVLVDLPPSYWRVPPGRHRIPYAELRENWGRWERERHWDRDKEWRAGGHGRPEGRGNKDRGRPERRGGEEQGRGHEEPLGDMKDEEADGVLGTCKGCPSGLSFMGCALQPQKLQRQKRRDLIGLFMREANSIWLLLPHPSSAIPSPTDLFSDSVTLFPINTTKAGIFSWSHSLSGHLHGSLSSFTCKVFGGYLSCLNLTVMPATRLNQSPNSLLTNMERFIIMRTKLWYT